MKQLLLIFTFGLGLVFTSNLDFIGYLDPPVSRDSRDSLSFDCSVEEFISGKSPALIIWNTLSGMVFTVVEGSRSD